MRRLLTSFSIALTLCSPIAAGARTIDEVIDREMPASGVPGLAYAVVDEGQITAAGARGVLRSDDDEIRRPEAEAYRAAPPINESTPLSV